MTIYLCIIKVRSDGKTIEAGSFGDCDYESKFHFKYYNIHIIEIFTVVKILRRKPKN